MPAAAAQTPITGQGEGEEGRGGGHTGGGGRRILYMA